MDEQLLQPTEQDRQYMNEEQEIECLGPGLCEAFTACEVAWCKRCGWYDEPGTHH